METRTAPSASGPATVPTSSAAVQVTDVHKSFGAVQALRGVSLKVAPGQVYGVLGPNGAGKTTLLRILLGLVRADRGAMMVLGQRPGTSEALRRVGALIETPAFVPHLSGRTNLQVLARAGGQPDTEVDRVLDLVELSHRGGDRFGGYSLGMGQRLGVAAALLGEPPLLILDEPTNGLDPEGVASMRTLVRDLGAAGTTVLLSSHQLGEVQQICDRVVVIDRGLVIADDTVTAIRNRPGSSALELWATPLTEAGRILAACTGARTAAGAGTERPADEGAGRAGGAGVEMADHAVAPQVGEAVLRQVGEPEDRHWHLAGACDDIPGLIRALVAAGVDVHEVRRERQTLEGVFFALTAPDGQEKS